MVCICTDYNFILALLYVVAFTNEVLVCDGW